MKNEAFLSLGSNVQKETNLPRAFSLLGKWGEVVAVSRVYETEPVGRPGQPTYLNAAVRLRTTHSAETLLSRAVAGIERRLRRVRLPEDPDAPRTIDVDLSLWNDAVLVIGRHQVPDPGILRYAHVAVPLADLAPDLVHPLTGQTLAAIAARLQASGGGIKPRPDIILTAGDPLGG